MAKIIVTSDSTCAMPRDIASSIGLNILPLNVIVNGVEYHDGIDIDLKHIAIKRNIAAIEITLVTTKSLSAMLIRSFVIAPSPVRYEFSV